MLEFIITLGLCSSWPLEVEKCVIVGQYEMELESHAQCILYGKLLADLIPLNVQYPIKVWTCNLKGENISNEFNH